MPHGVERTPSPEGAAPPPGGYPSWDAYLADPDDPWTHGAHQRAADYDTNHQISHRISKAMRLAPNVIVFNALLEGQPVPHEALDQKWLPRYR